MYRLQAPNAIMVIYKIVFGGMHPRETSQLITGACAHVMNET